MKEENKLKQLWRVYIGLFRDYPFVSLRLAAGNIISAFTQVVAIGTLYPVISVIVDNSGSRSRVIVYFDRVLAFFGFSSSLFNYLLLFVVSALVSFAVYSLSEIDRDIFLRHFETKMRFSFLQKIIYSRWDSLRNIKHGDFVDAVCRESDSYRLAVFYLLSIISTLFQVIFFSYFIFRINHRFAIFSFGLLVTGFLLFMPIMKLANKLGEESARLYAAMTTSLINACRSFKNIKAGSLEKYLLSRFRQLISDISHNFYKIQVSTQIFHLKLYELTGYFILAILLFVGLAVVGIEKAKLVLFLAFLIRLVPMVTSLSDLLCRAVSNLPALAKIDELLGQCHLDKGEDVRRTLLDPPLHTISLNNVSFGYKDKVLFDSLLVNFKKGEFWAICGPTGSGKTTILDIISGITDSYGGAISYNGIDAKQIKLSSLHQRVNYLTQHNFIFSGTILENICWGNDHPDLSRLDEVLRLSRLDGLVKQKTLDFMVSESGQNLSVGEQQRISIARALLEKCDFILMDEPTSALDAKTEEEFLSSLVSLKGVVGVIMVTHKQEFLRHADHVLHISNRKIEIK